MNNKERGWWAAAAFGFVLLALIVLAVIPTLMLRRMVKELTDTTSTVLPAYEALNGLLFAAEERIVASRSARLAGVPVLVPGGPGYAEQLTRAKQRESEALATLSVLAPRFGDGFSARLKTLKRFAAQRDSLELATDTIRSEQAHVAALPKFDALHDSMFVQAQYLRQDLDNTAQAQVEETGRFARLQGTVSLILGVLTIIAAFIVGWFAWLQRSQRRRTQEALAETRHQREIAERGREELRRASESRIRLLRGITHDVKNPIGAAKGYAELLALGIKAPLDPEQAPLVRGIDRTLNDALAIINDLLDIARAESGGLTIEREPLDLAAITAAAVEDHRATAGRTGHTLVFQRSDRPVPVCSDAARIRQVIDNLLSNAIKYTPPPGRITVRTEVIEEIPNIAPRAMVRITDTGPGIPPNLREAIFDEFMRVGETGVKGHGLGLAISRRLARMLDGDLILTDTDRPGATFEFTLPLDTQPRG